MRTCWAMRPLCEEHQNALRTNTCMRPFPPTTHPHSEHQHAVRKDYTATVLCRWAAMRTISSHTAKILHTTHTGPPNRYAKHIKHQCERNGYKTRLGHFTAMRRRSQRNANIRHATKMLGHPTAMRTTSKHTTNTYNTHAEPSDRYATIIKTQCE